MEMRIRQITKRDGRTVDFDIRKISSAIYKAAETLGGRDEEMALYGAIQAALEDMRMGINRGDAMSSRLRDRTARQRSRSQRAHYALMECPSRQH